MPSLQPIIFNKDIKIKMQPQNHGSRWKGLMQSKPSLTNLNESRQKPKKYTPTRTQTSSDLNKKIKVVSTSRLNISSDIDLAPRLLQQKQSFSRYIEPNERKSPTRNNSDFNSQNKLRPSVSSNSNQELYSPTILFKQLTKINRTENSLENHSKALFSLDQEHLYIHEELGKIKAEFVKMKQIFMAQLVRYQKEMDGIVRKILEKLEEVLLACHAGQDSGIRISIDSVKEVGRANNFFENQMESLNLSIIKKESSITDSKIELKKFLGEESARIDKALVNKLPQSMASKPGYEPAKTDRIDQLPESIPVKPKYEPPKTDRLEQKKSSPIRSGIPKQKSKKQFQKLFQAVNCLKRDIKDLNTFSVEINRKQPQFTKNQLVKSFK